MSEKEDEDMRREWLRHGKLFSKQKQIMLQRQGSAQIIQRLNMRERSPQWSVQQKRLEDQDVAVTVQSSQAHPDVYQTQVGIRLGLDSLGKPPLGNTKQELMKLRTQIEDFIVNTLRTDSEKTAH